MITDVFYERYKGNETILALKPAELLTPLNQGVQIIAREGGEILRGIESSGQVQKSFGVEQIAESAHARVCRELGWDRLNPESGAFGRCKAAINSHQVPDAFSKHGPRHMLALSVLEQLFHALERGIEKQIGRLQEYCLKMEIEKLKSGRAVARDGTTHEMECQAKIDKANKLVEWAKGETRKAIDELNLRMSRAGLPLAYHNGLFQITSESTISRAIVEPFWLTFSDAKWASVVTDFQEAIDRRDNGGRDATKYAFIALESVARIISDEQHRTIGNERGFANLLGNLVREVNGHRVIDQWEAEALIKLNDAARNLHSHGPGADPHPTKTPAQVNACIWTAMAWAQSLVSR